MKKALIFNFVVLIVVNIGLWGYIVPYLSSIDSTMNTEYASSYTIPIETNVVEQDPTDETVYDTTEYTVPCTTVPREKEIIKDYNIEFSYGERVTPSIEINTSNGIRNNINDVDTDEYKYIGKFTITGYTPTCKHCCGSSKGITASGVEAIPGYTIAANKSIPFGTTVYIEGYGYYVVEDRGVGNNHIDIAANNHEECYTLTDTKVDVYIVPYITEIMH